MRYQDILQKALVGLKIANTRFEPGMKFGDTVTRFILDLSGVRVRAFTSLVDRTIDPLADTTQNMLINIQVGAVFPIARLDKIQAGPLNPAMVAGKNIAVKVATYLDAYILAEARSAFTTFDTGSLTTGVANGTPITLSSTTIPQLVMNAPAVLQANNAPMTNLCWVIDPLTLSAIGQFPIGKELSNDNTTFKNGYAGPIGGSEFYVSNNLTGEATLVSTGVFSDGDTVTIGGVVLTMKTALGAVAGQVLIGAAATNSIQNIAALLNAPGTTTATGVALSASDQIKVTDIMRITATATSATVLTIVGIGSSRLTLSKSAASWTWATNFVHCYFGQKGAIDVAVQDQPEIEMRDEPKQLTTNIFNDVVAAIKTFTDGSQYFLDVKIANA